MYQIHLVKARWNTATAQRIDVIDRKTKAFQRELLRTDDQAGTLNDIKPIHSRTVSNGSATKIYLR